jgi:hypothetical protein
MTRQFLETPDGKIAVRFLLTYCREDTAPESFSGKVTVDFFNDELMAMAFSPKQ